MSVSALWLGLVLLAIGPAREDTTRAEPLTIHIENGRVYVGNQTVQPDSSGVVEIRLSGGERIFILPSATRPARLAERLLFSPARDLLLRIPPGINVLRLEERILRHWDPETELRLLERELQELEARLRNLRRQLSRLSPL